MSTTSVETIKFGGEMSKVSADMQKELASLKNDLPPPASQKLHDSLVEKNATRKGVQTKLAEIRNALPEDNTVLISKLSALEGRLTEIKTTTEKALDVGGVILDGTIDLGKKGIEMGNKGIDMINDQSMPVKLGAYGALAAGGSWVVSKIARWFGEGGKKFAETIGKGGRWIGGGLGIVAAAVGLGKLFGYDLDIKKETDTSTPK